MDRTAIAQRESHVYLLCEGFPSWFKFPLFQGRFQVIPKKGMSQRNFCRLDRPVRSDLKFGRCFSLHAYLAGPPWIGGSNELGDVGRRGRWGRSLSPCSGEKKNTDNQFCHF